MPNLNSLHVMAAAGALAMFVLGAATSSALTPAPPRMMPLLSTDETIMGEPIVYPAGSALLTTAVISLPPGGQTGWHTHGVPVTGYILEGELTVDYGERGKRKYKKGMSVAEAISIPHNGTNTGETDMRLFVVYIGAEGLQNSTPAKQ
ncbi:cupin domain-containing protein [Hyphomicrobium methylovorum]|uniref:cupin domain-containing protein n=1 Tax=Hyphomicrobium methylovorum TaxID=84 RepID=UPI0015E64170|nr:cupin domain-containing protein [Hyphomicrobium methylovorum]MBA2126782.1 cupin domain-containing protein [Hyphomicrobium methylovorum]